MDPQEMALFPLQSESAHAHMHKLAHACFVKLPQASYGENIFSPLPSLEQILVTRHTIKIIFYLLREVIRCNSRRACQGSQTKTTPLFWWICSMLLNTMWKEKLMNEAQVSLRGFSKSVHQKSQHIPNSFKRGCWWAYFKANNTAALTSQLYYLTVPTGT